MDANHLFDKYMVDVDITRPDGTPKKAVEVGMSKVQSGEDSYGWKTEGGQRVKDYEKVCMRCVKDIIQEAGIQMPQTNNVATFMDAVEGRPVELFNHIGERRVYPPSVDWGVIDSAADLREGDIMIVNNSDGGYHAVLVKNVSGSPDRNGLFRGYFSGVDVIHDRAFEYAIEAYERYLRETSQTHELRKAYREEIKGELRQGNTEEAFKLRDELLQYK